MYNKKLSTILNKFHKTKANIWLKSLTKLIPIAIIKGSIKWNIIKYIKYSLKIQKRYPKLKS